jgi:hypothetical protein
MKYAYKICRYVLLFILFSGMWACKDGQKETKEASTAILPVLSDDSLMTRVQYETFQYFWDGAEPVSGMGRERYHEDNVYPRNDKHIVTTGGSGFGMMAILVGIERGFITREEGYQRLRQIINWLEKADRFHGAWPHWLNGETGEASPFSKKDDGGDLVETAFLIQGMLTVRQYFKDGNEAEQKLAEDIDRLWKEVEWDWYTKNNEPVLYWHWSKNYGWEMNHKVRGYNECLIMYVLAASSPTHSVPAEVYHKGWARDGDIVSNQKAYNYPLVLEHSGGTSYGGPLFWAHYSYLGLDPRNLKDRYGDYWQLNTSHAMINYEYCKENPMNFDGYGANLWGLTSSYSMRGYAGHRPEGRDLGVISPTAALSSFPYTPTQSMDFLRNMYTNLDTLIGEFGPYDAFSIHHKWYVPRYLAIDQGPIPVMIENYRTGLLWDLFMSCHEVQ